MRFCLYTISISPHQLPLAQEMVKLLGADEYRYVYKEGIGAERKALGWTAERPSWMISAESADAKDWLEGADVLMSGERDLDLFALRSAAGKKTIYCSERWFKPIRLGRWLRVPGRVRMLVPRYRRMAGKIMALVRRDPNFMLYPMGIHAARDFASLLGCRIDDFERFPGGRFSGRGPFLDKMRLWGYFVAPSTGLRAACVEDGRGVLRVLWVGRLIAWKKVETLLVATAIVCEKLPVALTIVGDGSARRRLERLAARLFGNHLDAVRFAHTVPIAHVRELMRENDVYVLTSDASEGWGAVVNEALEEGMIVFGTQEAGSCATILPKEQQFRAGDAKRLAELVCAVWENHKAAPNGEPWLRGINPWSANRGAAFLVRWGFAGNVL